MKVRDYSDGQLVGLFKEGHDSAFEELLNRHKAKVFTTIYLIVKDRYVAEDLLQETFVKAIDTIRAGRYNEEGKFQPWLVRVAHNMAIDYFRKSRRYPQVLMEDGNSLFDTIEFAEDSFESVKIRDETHAHLRKLIQTLPEPQREVLIMRHYAKMSFQEIADVTGVSINTALGRMRYALINLRKKMKVNAAYDKKVYPR